MFTMAAALERNSEHPLAEAVVARARRRHRAARRRRLRPYRDTVEGTVMGMRVAFGNRKLMAREGIQMTGSSRICALEDEGKTVRSWA
jgi:cation transport ATPase